MQKDDNFLMFFVDYSDFMRTFALDMTSLASH